MISPPALDVLHRPIAALVRAYGAPTSVATRDDGQHVIFGDATASVSAIVDDDATIHAVDLLFPAGTRVSVEVEGKTHTFTFGTTTSLGARDELATDAETEGASFRVFRRSPETDLVLVFEPKTSLLTHVVTGDHATVLRIDLDRGGIVRNVTVIVASDDADFDAQLVARLAHDAYAPAKLGGRSIGSSVLREVRH